MRKLTLAVPILALLALPVWAGNTIELVEMKNGRLYEAQELRVKGDRLWIKLAEKQPGQKVAFSVPIDKVVPEFVYHAWVAQIRPDSERDQLKLAAWARKQGLFALALKTYKGAAALSPKARSELEAFEAGYEAEESAFLYRKARDLFDAGRLKEARVLSTQALSRFPDSVERKAVEELIKIVDEREAFLTEEKKRKEAERLLKRQKRDYRRLQIWADRGQRYIGKADFIDPPSALRRLQVGTAIYGRVMDMLIDRLPYVENGGLRDDMRKLLESLHTGRTTALLLLADGRYMTGDVFLSMQTAHELIAIDPGNEGAHRLREQILSGSAGGGGGPFSYGHPIGIYTPERIVRRRALDYLGMAGYNGGDGHTKSGFGVHVLWHTKGLKYRNPWLYYAKRAYGGYYPRGY